MRGVPDAGKHGAQAGDDEHPGLLFTHEFISSLPAIQSFSRDWTQLKRVSLATCGRGLGESNGNEAVLTKHGSSFHRHDELLQGVFSYFS